MADQPLPPADEPSLGSIQIPVADADARTAVWLGHKWTRRIAAAFVSLFGVAAGLWGHAQLEATRGVRSDVQALVQRLDRSDDRLQALAVEAAGRDARVVSVETRLQAVEARTLAAEAKCDAAMTARYGRALEQYEARQEKKYGNPSASTP